MPAYRRDLALGLDNLGTRLRDNLFTKNLGERPEAEAAFRRALAIEEKLAADFPAVPGYRFELANSHNGLGNLLMELRRLPEAEAAFRRALAIDQELAADFPAMPAYRARVGHAAMTTWGICWKG